MANEKPPLKTPGNDGNVYKCPICKTLLENADITSFPFCTDRCRLVDLQRWLQGSYQVSRPVDPTDHIEDLPKSINDRNGGPEKLMPDRPVD